LAVWLVGAGLGGAGRCFQQELPAGAGDLVAQFDHGHVGDPQLTANLTEAMPGEHVVEYLRLAGSQPPPHVLLEAVGDHFVQDPQGIISAVGPHRFGRSSTCRGAPLSVAPPPEPDPGVQFTGAQVPLVRSARDTMAEADQVGGNLLQQFVARQ